VESKIRLLVQNLEKHRCIALAHVNPKCFTRTVEIPINSNDSTPDTSDNNEDKTKAQETKTEEETMWFIGLEFNKAEGINVDLTQDIKSFAETGL
jgi:poly(A) polymerase Pap1